jgi:hypothetical protein
VVLRGDSIDEYKMAQGRDETEIISKRIMFSTGI